MPPARLNDTATAFDIIEKYREDGKSIPEDFKDDLLFGALVELMKTQKDILDWQKKWQPWIAAWKWAVLLIGPAGVLGGFATIWALLTHQFKY